MKYFIKIITGFREDQFHTIPMQEAHKAYFLFRNPEQRGIFNNGVALTGSSIKEIVPDYNATMGWNPTHRMTSEDFNELRADGVQGNMNILMERARTVAQELVPHDPRLLQQQLGELIKMLPENESLETITGDTVKKLTGKN